jgi:hypothetical protein
MRVEQLKSGAIVRGPIFPEPVQVIVVIPMGQSVKLVGKGLTTGQVAPRVEFLPKELKRPEWHCKNWG